MKYYSIKYSDDVEGGEQTAFIIRINSKYKHDKGIIAHEKEHVKQWYLVTLLSLAAWFFAPIQDAILSAVVFILCFCSYSLLYSIPYFQKLIEIRCYKVQLGHYPDKLDGIADILATKYSFKMTKAEAIKALT